MKQGYQQIIVNLVQATNFKDQNKDEVINENIKDLKVFVSTNVTDYFGIVYEV